MTVAIGASGIMGVALEAVSGVYEPPVKFIPFESESLSWQQDTNWRRPIRNTPGLVGAVAGNGHVEGELGLEALHDCVAYLLHASRCTVVKSGLSPNFIYTFTPAPDAVPSQTLSISIKRNGEVFGYTGCVVGGFTFSIDNGTLKFSVDIKGNTEATQAALVPTWPTSVPFGAGSYVIEIPTATQVFDTDSFEFQSEDNAEVQFRLKDELGAQFVSFGESSATLTVERDFENRAEYDAFKALTAQSITMKASQGADIGIDILMPAAVKESYEVNIGGQGDLLRASVGYQGVIDGTGKHYEIVVRTTEDIT